MKNVLAKIVRRTRQALAQETPTASGANDDQEHNSSNSY